MELLPMGKSSTAWGQVGSAQERSWPEWRDRQTNGLTDGSVLGWLSPEQCPVLAPQGRDAAVTWLLWELRVPWAPLVLSMLKVPWVS